MLALSQGAQADILRVEGRDGTLAETDVAEGAEWCLTWNHSVTGGAVADCFVNVAGRMMLSRSYLHDFAAGLGTVEGRGTLRSAPGGGYWIDGIDEHLAGNALVLRVGSPSVAHRLRVGTRAVALSDLAAVQRVTLRLIRTD